MVCGKEKKISGKLEWASKVEYTELEIKMSDDILLLNALFPPLLMSSSIQTTPFGC